MLLESLKNRLQPEPEPEVLGAYIRRIERKGDSIVCGGIVCLHSQSCI